jgi:hypothetical protein
VKWDSTLKITKKERADLEKELNTKVNRWVEVLVGYEGWAYPNVATKIVSWAATSKETLTEMDATAEGFTYYENTCNTNCYRYTHKNGQYPTCPGGDSAHHDMVLTLNDKNKGGGSVSAPE